jgi:hypothetical protein
MKEYAKQGSRQKYYTKIDIFHIWDCNATAFGKQ